LEAFLGTGEGHSLYQPAAGFPSPRFFLIDALDRNMKGHAMNIVIVGAGNVGRALAGGWRKTGHQITFAVRDPDKAGLAELKTQGFGVVRTEAASAAADVIVLAVPWLAVQATLKALGALGGKIVVDATNPVAPGLTLAIGHSDSAGETVARLAPGARVVKAFNTTGAGNMADGKYPGRKLMMPVAGDNAEAKRIVMGLASELGFDPIDAGLLIVSRELEPMAMLWIKLALLQKQGNDFGFALLRRP
jgi:predicted dinucleotide-binding enzyme